MSASRARSSQEGAAEPTSLARPVPGVTSACGRACGKGGSTVDVVALDMRQLAFDRVRGPFSRFIQQSEGRRPKSVGSRFFLGIAETPQRRVEGIVGNRAIFRPDAIPVRRTDPNRPPRSLAWTRASRRGLAGRYTGPMSRCRAAAAPYTTHGVLVRPRQSRSVLRGRLPAS